jgi:hypothetical protein
MYDGDTNPDYTGGETDQITFFRRSSGTNTSVFSYIHNSNTVYFYGGVRVTGAITASSNISASGTGSFGMVGIGTTSPGAKLDVNGAQIIQSTAAFGTGADQAALYLSNTANFGLSGNFNGYSRNLIKSNGSNLLTIGRSNSSLISELSIESGNSGLMKFLAGGSERMRITSTGNVGIGTGTPTANLHVAGNIWASGSSGHITASGNISASGTIIADNIVVGGTTVDGSGLTANGRFVAQSSDGSDWFTVGKSGAGIVVFNSQGGTTQAGGTDLGARFNIQAISDSVPALAIRGQNGSSDLVRVNSYNTTTGDYLNIKNDGKVGIGTTSPPEKLTVEGNISASGNIYSDELWLNDKLRIYNTAAGQRISGSGEIFFASNKFEFNDVNISFESPPEFMRINGDTNILGNVTSSGTISSSLNDANHVLGGQLSLMGTANGSIHLYAGGSSSNKFKCKRQCKLLYKCWSTN